MSIKAVNGNLVLKLVETESKTAGGIVLTQSQSAAKNRAVVIDGGDSERIAEFDMCAVRNHATVIFNTKEVLETVDQYIIVPQSAILAVVS